MVIEPFLISSSILAIVAQRLVRILCIDCRQSYLPDKTAMENIGISPDLVKDTVLYRAKGCDNCFNTGYKGRVAISEILVMDEKLKNLILKTHDSNQIKNEALKQNMETLRDDGIRKVIKGVTSISEVLRVTQR